MTELTQGNPQALATLYDRHAAAMFGLAQRVLGDRRDAEDLVHDVFLESWNKAARYDPRRGSVRTWLLVMVRSRALDRLRALAVMRKHAQRGADGDLASAVSHVEPEGLRGVDRARAIAAIAALPEAQRQVVQLSCLEGLSCSEIAQRCGLPLGTVKSRLARAMDVLRARLGADEEPN